ncbi:transcription elongation factor [Pyrrhoderma noxium]|uniref:Transcription elongation factor n=1 Tax=Pyrrhoderma noxium TaxID=2282107 RepID=A0A286UUT4_9AGAM|nr:transcription elongation factor [Pyrrhoderma noxium]
MTVTDVTELKKLAKDLQKGGTSEQILDILKTLKDVAVTEAVLRESKIGLAVGKLRSSSTKEVSDAAKELVKKWKNEVDRSKQHVAKATPPPSTPTGTVRSSKTDGITINVTRDKTRDKCIELIYDSLCTDSTAPSDLLLKRATAIEKIVLEDHNGDMGRDYKGKIRSLFLNLKDKNNPGLRENVTSGELKVEKLCKMSSQEMASEERKKADQAIEEQNLHNSLGAEEQQAETDAFQCGKCKQRKTRYRQAQTRSADEPMTTFVTCVNCNHRWKFS